MREIKLISRNLKQKRKGKLFGIKKIIDAKSEVFKSTAVGKHVS